MKLSNIIGKQVFVVYDATFLGTVNDVAFDNKYTKILGLYFFDQEENEYFVKTQNIFAMDDFVIIKNTNKISNEFLLNKPLSPLGKNIVNHNGKDYGQLSDLEIDEKFNITNFISNNNNSFTPKEIIIISKNIVIGDLKLCNFKPRNNNKQFLSLENLTINVMKLPENNLQKLMPSKITVNSDVLIGKKLSKDIYGKNNELILKQNQIITPKQVVSAKQHDKLNELFYSVY